MRKISSKLMAIFMAVMLLVPMAAQAEGSNNFTNIELSDLIVNYAGTEFDFSGLNLSVNAGTTEDGKNTLTGMLLNMPALNYSKGLEFEIGEKGLTMLLLDRLVELPYDRLNDMAKKMGMETGMTDEQIVDTINQFKAQLPALKTVNIDGSIDELIGRYLVESVNYAMLDDEVRAEIEKIVEEAAADAEDAKFTDGDDEYEGKSYVVKISPELASKIISSNVATVKEAMNTFMAALAGSGLVDVNSDEDMQGQMDALFDTFSNISYPDGCTLKVFTHEEADEAFAAINVERVKVDMTQYIKALAGMTEISEELSENLSVFEMDIDLTMDYTLKDGSIDSIDDYHYDLKEYRAESDAALVEASMEYDGGEDGGIDMLMNIYPQSFANAPEDAEPMGVQFSMDWTDKEDGSETVSMLVTALQNEEILSKVGVDLSSRDTKTGKSGTITLNVADAGTTSAMNICYDLAKENDSYVNGNFAVSLNDGIEAVDVLKLSFKNVKSKADPADVNDVSFEANIMQMLGLSGKLKISVSPMEYEYLLSAGGSDTLNLADATDADMQNLMAGLQTTLQEIIMKSMSIDGVSDIIMMNSESADGGQAAPEVVSDADADSSLAGNSAEDIIIVEGDKEPAHAA